MNTSNPISNCLVSKPIYYPDEEVVVFNGFAWSNSKGIILQSISPSPTSSFNDWLGNQE